MMKWLLFIFVIVRFSVGSCQEEGGYTPSPEIPSFAGKVIYDTIRIYTKVDGRSASFPSGDAALKAYTLDKLQFPKMVLSGEVEGSVKMRFVVERDGAISNVDVMEGIEFCPECGEAATNFVKGMPKWNPATTTEGGVVRSYVSLSVDFKIPTFDVTFNPESDPHFPGGHVAFLKYFRSNFVIPETHRHATFYYKIVARFEVEVDGSINNLKLIKGAKNAPEIDEEVMRVLHLMPKWVPGSIFGEVKTMLVNLPIKIEY